MEYVRIFRRYSGREYGRNKRMFELLISRGQDQTIIPIVYPTVIILVEIGILPKCMFELLICRGQDQTIIPIPQYQLY